jgi:hypothetical protein
MILKPPIIYLRAEPMPFDGAIGALMNTHIHLITRPIDHKIHKIIITCVSLSIGISFTTEKI